MNKISLLFLFFITTITYAADEIPIGKYINAQARKELEILAHVENGVVKYVYLEVITNQNKQCFVRIPVSKLQQFNSALDTLQSRLDYYNQGLKEKGVNNAENSISSCNFPLVSVYWKSGSSWHVSHNNRLRPYYKKIDAIPFGFISMSDKVVSNSNRYIEVAYMWILSGDFEFKALHKLLNLEYIQNTISEKSVKSL